MSKVCKHENFSAAVKIARLEDIGRFMAEVRVTCCDCGKPFQFLGLQPGLNLRGPTVSIDGLEANLAICPEGDQPSPFQQMAHGRQQFDG